MIFGKNKKTEDTNNTQKSVEEAAISRWRSINSANSSSDSNATEQNELTDYISDEYQDSDNFNDSEENYDDIVHLDSFQESEDQDDIKLNSTEIPVVKLDTVFEESPVNLPKSKSTPMVPIADFNANCEQDLKARFGSDLKSALGSGTVIEGIFSFNSPVRIDGILKGEIRSNSALIVGKKAKVHANIKVGSLIVLGSVQGEVEADDLIEIRSSGQLIADVTTSRLALEEGGVFSGSCSMI